MDTEAFYDNVVQRGDFASEEDARETVRSVLRAFSESVTRGTAEEVAEMLPPDAAEHMLSSEFERADPVAYEEFLDRVSRETGVDRDIAQRKAQAVVTTLSKAMGEHEFDALHSQLTEEYDRIFEVEAKRADFPLVDAVVAGSDLTEHQAREAVEATLQTLAERVSLGEAEDVAAYLGEESRWIIDRKEPYAEDFTVEDFHRRVARRLKVGEKTARERVDAVFDAMGAVVAQPELHAMEQQLPEEYEPVMP